MAAEDGRDGEGRWTTTEKMMVFLAVVLQEEGEMEVGRGVDRIGVNETRLRRGERKSLKG